MLRRLTAETTILARRCEFSPPTLACPGFSAGFPSMLFCKRGFPSHGDPFHANTCCYSQTSLPVAGRSVLLLRSTHVALTTGRVRAGQSHYAPTGKTTSLYRRAPYRGARRRKGHSAKHCCRVFVLQPGAASPRSATRPVRASPVRSTAPRGAPLAYPRRTSNACPAVSGSRARVRSATPVPRSRSAMRWPLTVRSSRPPNMGFLFPAAPGAAAA